MAAGSTLPQRAAGRELRRLRMRAGKSQTAAGKVIEVSPQTIGRMGRRATDEVVAGVRQRAV
ncbi:helix-turn-helix domain-containing protein [Nocardia cyriacigeorgica]|nr:helix-turn-helix domain-containing protein [Nocardia cyriacigeorgica]